MAVNWPQKWASLVPGRTERHMSFITIHNHLHHLLQYIWRRSHLGATSIRTDLWRQWSVKVLWWALSRVMYIHLNGSLSHFKCHLTPPFTAIYCRAYKAYWHSCLLNQRQDFVFVTKMDMLVLISIPLHWLSQEFYSKEWLYSLMQNTLRSKILNPNIT